MAEHARKLEVGEGIIASAEQRAEISRLSKELGQVLEHVDVDNPMPLPQLQALIKAHNLRDLERSRGKQLKSNKDGMRALRYLERQLIKAPTDQEALDRLVNANILPSSNGAAAITMEAIPVDVDVVADAVHAQVEATVERPFTTEVSVLLHQLGLLERIQPLQATDHKKRVGTVVKEVDPAFDKSVVRSALNDLATQLGGGLTHQDLWKMPLATLCGQLPRQRPEAEMAEEIDAFTGKAVVRSGSATELPDLGEELEDTMVQGEAAPGELRAPSMVRMSLPKIPDAGAVTDRLDVDGTIDESGEDDVPRKKRPLPTQAAAALEKRKAKLAAARTKPDGVIPPDSTKGHLRETYEQHLEAGILHELEKKGYTDIHLINKGGMGAIYSATDSLGREVALKITLHPASSEAISKQICEFKIVASMANDTDPTFKNVAVDVRSVETINDYLVADIELMRSPNLAEYLEKRDYKVSPPKAVDILIAVVERMKQLHKRGIIHRDLKPENIFRLSEGTVKISDFGLATKRKFRDDEEEIAEVELGEDTHDMNDPDNAGRSMAQMTMDGPIMGTPNYMPPEQATGKQSVLGPGADIYALGIMFYEMLTGNVPFNDGGPLQRLSAHCMEIPRDPMRRAKNRSVEAEINRIFHKMVAKAVVHAGKRSSVYAPKADGEGEYEIVRAKEFKESGAPLRYRNCDALLKDLYAVQELLDPEAIRRHRRAMLGRIGGGIAAAIFAALAGKVFFGKEDPTNTPIGGNGPIKPNHPEAVKSKFGCELSGSSMKLSYDGKDIDTVALPDAVPETPVSAEACRVFAKVEKKPGRTSIKFVIFELAERHDEKKVDAFTAALPERQGLGGRAVAKLPWARTEDLHFVNRIELEYSISDRTGNVTQVKDSENPKPYYSSEFQGETQAETLKQFEEHLTESGELELYEELKIS